MKIFIHLSQEKIKKIVILTLLSGKYKFSGVKNTFEIFGFDIMVDIDLNCYLIEVNSSPAFDYSTKVTEKLVKEISEEALLMSQKFSKNIRKRYIQLYKNTSNKNISETLKNLQRILASPELSESLLTKTLLIELYK